jgi:hypothetical protein
MLISFSNVKFDELFPKVINLTHFELNFFIYVKIIWADRPLLIFTECIGADTIFFQDLDTLPQHKNNYLVFTIISVVLLVGVLIWGCWVVIKITLFLFLEIPFVLW